VNREFHARICGGVRVRFSYATRLRNRFGAGNLSESSVADFKSLTQVFGGYAFLDGLSGDGDGLLAQYLFACGGLVGDD